MPAATPLSNALADANTSFDRNKEAGSHTSSCPYRWIEIELVDKDGDPVPFEAYRVTLPDDSTVDGSLNEQGFVRISAIPQSGDCQIEFPRLHAKSWERIS